MGRPKVSNKSGAPGSEGVSEAWDKAANRSEPAKAKRKQGEQLRIKVDSRDAVHIKAKHELHRPMSHSEWQEQAELLASNRVELMGLEDEIRKLRERHAPRMKDLRAQIDNGARQCDSRSWLTVADCIEVHDVNTRTVTVFADVNGELGAEVIPARKMHDDEYERALKDSPFDPPPVLPAPPADAERIDLDEPADRKSAAANDTH